MTSEAAPSPDCTGYIRIRTPDDPHGWTAEGDLMLGHPYLYSSGDIAVEVTWAAAPSLLQERDRLDVESIARSLKRRYHLHQSIPELMMGLDIALAATPTAEEPTNG